MHKKLISLPEMESGAHKGLGVGKPTIPARIELIVQLPVGAGSRIREGIVEKAIIASGLYLAECLVKENNGHIITSILNTREQDVELPKPVVKVVELKDHDAGKTAVIGVAEQEKCRDDPGQSRRERVMAKLRTDHLKSEEKKSLHELCFDYQDVFFLSGDKLSCTNAVRHTIQLQPGVIPINTRPYRLPESQKEEIDRQVK